MNNKNKNKSTLLLLENEEMVETSKVLIYYVALKETFVLQSDELSHMTVNKLMVCLY